MTTTPAATTPALVVAADEADEAPVAPASRESARPVDPDDPREQIFVGVLMLNGRLAGRSFADRAEAEAWAQPGEQVVEYNLLCECDR